MLIVVVENEEFFFAKGSQLSLKTNAYDADSDSTMATTTTTTKTRRAKNTNQLNKIFSTYFGQRVIYEFLRLQKLLQQQL